MRKFMNSLDWIMRSHLLFIEGEGGGGDAGGSGGSGGGGGADPGGSGSGGGTGGGAPAAPAAPVTATPAAVTGEPAVPIATQQATHTLVDDTTGRPTRELDESREEFIARHREWSNKQPRDGAEKTPEQLAAEKTAADKAVADKVAFDKAAEAKRVADQAKTPEQVAAETKAAEDKKLADDAAAKKLQEDGASEYDDYSPVTTEKLAEMAKDPDFQKLLEKYQATEGDMFATSRLADKAVKLMQIHPTLEAAQHSKMQASAFHQLSDAFTGIKPGDIGSTSKFLHDTLLPMSYLRDEQGKVMTDKASGLPMTDGTVFSFMENIYDTRNDFLAGKIEKAGTEAAIGAVLSTPSFTKILNSIAKVAEKMGGDRGEMIKAAVDELKGCGKAGSPSGNEDDLPESVKARLAEADRVTKDAATRKQELDTREAAVTEKRISDFKTGVLNESSTEIDSMIGGFLDKTSLKDDKFLRSTVMQKVRDALYENMAADDLYLSQRDYLTLSGMTKTTHNAWKSLNIREAKARLKSIADPILAEAGAKKISRAQERQQSITTQKDQSRVEPKGGVSTALPHAQVTDDHQLLAQAKQNLRDAGKDVDTLSVLAEFRKLKAAPAA